jgi:hypothetical protein
VALCQARISTKPLWGFSSSNPYHSQSRAEQPGLFLPKKKKATSWPHHLSIFSFTTHFKT